MKHLKSSSQGLRQLFDKNISIRHVAEPFTSFDADSPAANVRAFMDEHDYDVVGVRSHGLIAGYVQRYEVVDGTLGNYLTHFAHSQLMDEDTPIITVFEALRNSPQVFVLFAGQVGGIVTRGDLQKAPVRMWFFGLISLIEMQLLRIIRESYPNDTWKKFLYESRLSQAEKILSDRQKRNQAIDLADCLQLGDKRDIVLKSDELRTALGFTSKRSGKNILKNLEKLRNNLAHAQDIITGQWPQIVDLADSAEIILKRFELAVIPSPLMSD